MKSIQILGKNGVSQQLFEMPVECVDFVVSIKAANESTDKPSSLKDIEPQSLDISFLIQSLGTFEEGDHLQGIPVLPQGLDGCGLKENKSYLVAGGVRGFGFEVARWMAENGAKSIVLLGRSMPSNSKIQEVRQIERSTGTTIHIIQVGRFLATSLSHQTFLLTKNSILEKYLTICLQFIRILHTLTLEC